MPSPSKIPISTKNPTNKKVKKLVNDKKNFGTEGKTKSESAVNTKAFAKPVKNAKPSNNSKSNGHNIGTTNCNNLPQQNPADTTGNNIVGRSRPKAAADRRGISEIKRSEQSLVLQVEQLEKDIRDLKLQIDELENDSTEKDTTNSSLKQVVSTLEEKNKKLKEENDDLCTVLEETLVNPVKKKPLSTAKSFRKKLQACEDECTGEAESLLKNVKSLNEAFDVGKKRIEKCSIED